MTPVVDTKIAGAIETGLAVFFSGWAGVRWLLWPRIRFAIRGEVDAAMTPIRDGILAEIHNLAKAIEHLAAEVNKQGKEQAGMQSSMNILLEDRRRGPIDRRTH